MSGHALGDHHGDVAGSFADATLWLGVFPGLSAPMLDFVVQSVHEFVAVKRNCP